MNLKFGLVRLRHADKRKNIRPGVELVLWTPGGQARVADLSLSELLQLVDQASSLLRIAIQRSDVFGAQV